MGILGAIFMAGKIAVEFVQDFVGEGFIDRIKNVFRKVAINMMNMVAFKLQSKMEEKILGTAHSYENINGQWVERAKNYTVDSELGEWNEIVVSKERALEEIPEEYRYITGEINDTEEIKEEMEMVYE